MPHATFHVRPLALFNDGANVESNTDTHDAGNSFELHAVCNTTAVTGSPSITAKAQHSIDGIHWVDLTSLAFTITQAGTLHASATVSCYRFVRFFFVNTVASTTATFEIFLFVKMHA